MRSERLAQIVFSLPQRFDARAGLLEFARMAINLIDYEQLRVLAPEISYDLPAGGRRMFQAAEGYRATLVSGQVVMENGEETGARPGRLVRGAQVAPEPTQSAA